MLSSCTRSASVAWAFAALAGCTPTLNWRDVSVEPTGLQALFPCKPERLSREGSPGGVPVRMGLLSCEAGGWTFAVGYADLAQGADSGRAVAAMRSALVVNAGGRQATAHAASAAGRVADPAAQRMSVRGRNADGRPVEVQAQFFSHGARVFQASVVGSTEMPRDAAQTFFEGLHWPEQRRD